MDTYRSIVVFEISEIIVDYYFQNKLYAPNEVMSDGWKKLLTVLVSDAATSENDILNIDNTIIKHQLSDRDPEEFADVSDMSSGLDIRAIIEDLSNLSNSLLDLSFQSKARLIAPSIDDVVLFNLLLHTNMPTYHISDAKITNVEIVNRIPISLVPKADLIQIKIDLHDTLKEECLNCGIELIINVTPSIQPNKEIITELVRSYLYEQATQCVHEDHHEIRKILDEYHVEDNFDPYKDEIMDILEL